MSQQHTTQTSGQGMLERVLKLREHGTTAQTEVIAGSITFLTMVYVVFANPQILGVADMDTSAVFVMTCLVAVFGSIMMGLFINLPVALASATGLNVFLAFVVMQAVGLPWQVGMGTIFWGAVGLLLLTVLHVRYWMIANIPVSLRVDITSGIGLSIGMVGLKNAGVIVANPKTLVSIGNPTSHSVLLGTLGFFIIAILASCNIHVVMLVSIVVVTLLGWALSNVHYSDIVSASPSVITIVGYADLAGLSNLGLAGMIFSLMLVNLFDSSGTLIGVTDKTGLADEKGKFPHMKQALYVDSISSVAGPFIGASFTTTYIRSSSDVSVDGRIGLTVVVVGLLFLLVIFLPPLAGMMPGYAAAGALIYVDALTTSNFTRVNWQDLTESILAFITTVMMPFSFSITEGIALGFISYYVMKIGTGRPHDLSPCAVIVALLFTPKIVFINTY